MAEDNDDNYFENSLNEEEPPHPKTFTHIPSKQRIIENTLNKSIKKTKNHDVFVKTARESYRKNEEKESQRNIYTSRNSREIVINPPSNKNSPRAQEEKLFIPERKQINEQNKYLISKRSLKVKPASFYAPSQLRESNNSIKFAQNDENNKSKLNKSQKPFSMLENRPKPNQMLENMATIHHISHLKKYQNTQKSREIELNNRLRFFTVEKEKDNKRLEFAKRKYEKVVAVRSQFIKEKEINQKKKLISYLEDMNEKHKKISIIKSQKQEKNLSVSRLSQTKSLEASRLRSEEKFIVYEKKNKEMSELEKKRESVKASQLRSQKAHEKLIQVNKSRIESLRSIENKQILKSYMNVSQKEKTNQKLQERLQKEIALINENKQKSANQLQKYEEFLGLRNKRFYQNSSINTSRSKSFYLTNY